MPNSLLALEPCIGLVLMGPIEGESSPQLTALPATHTMSVIMDYLYK